MNVDATVEVKLHARVPISIVTNHVSSCSVGLNRRSRELGVDGQNITPKDLPCLPTCLLSVNERSILCQHHKQQSRP